MHSLLPVIRAILWGGDAGHVHRLVEQRRGKRRGGKRKKMVRWERHEAHIIAVEVNEQDDSSDQRREHEQAKEESATANVAEHKENKEGGYEEKESKGRQRWWREHEPELPLPAWKTSDRNTREREEQQAHWREPDAAQKQAELQQLQSASAMTSEQ